MQKTKLDIVFWALLLEMCILQQKSEDQWISCMMTFIWTNCLTSSSKIEVYTGEVQCTIKVFLYLLQDMLGMKYKNCCIYFCLRPVYNFTKLTSIIVVFKVFSVEDFEHRVRCAEHFIWDISKKNPLGNIKYFANRESGANQYSCPFFVHA